MDLQDKRQQDRGWWPDDVVFVPDEVMRAFERAELKTWQARQEFRKIAESMKREKL